MAIKTGLAAGLAAVLWSGTASAVATSMNWIELGSIATVDACIATGEAAMTASGLRLLTPTQSAAWAEAQVGEELYSVYCIVDRGIAVVIGSGTVPGDAPDDLDTVTDTINRIIGNFGRTGPSTGKPR